MKDRLVQKRLRELAKDVIAGTFAGNKAVVDCTPGGGKTGTGTLLANMLLDAGVLTKVLWLVPRLSLAEQVAEAFSSGFGSIQGRCLDVADANDVLFPNSLPSMPACVGHVVTYQTITAGKNYERFRNAMLCHRTLLLNDEVQFLFDENNGDDMKRGWYKKVLEVHGAAAFALEMTGTLWRTDNRRIPFIDYEKRSDGKYYPLSNISYSLREAVRDEAVLPIEWWNRGGLVEYNHGAEPHLHDLADDNDDEESRKLRTFLGGEKTVCKLLDDMVDHWRDWCRKTYQSRMIVMADDTRQARRWRQYLQDRHGISCVLATSKEESAGRKLRHFREGKHGQCLVTVAMAYIGFDCPDLTHLAYLSAVRAPSWMLQSFARISRHDHHAPVDYSHQHAFVFGPDDIRFREFLTWLREQQEMGIKDKLLGRGPVRPADTIAMPDDFEPIDAAAGARVIESLERRIDSETAKLLDEFVERCPAAANQPRSQLYEILEKAGVDLRLVLSREAVHVP